MKANYAIAPEYPPRHKTGQVGRLKQDSPSTWIFSSKECEIDAKTEWETTNTE